MEQLQPLEAPLCYVPLPAMLSKTEVTIAFQCVLFLPSDYSIPKCSCVFPRASEKFRTELQWLRAVFPQV